MEREYVERAIALAEQILTLSRNSLFVNLRFLENALGRFELCPYPGTVGTDGSCIFYQPFHIMKRYREAEKLVVHDFLHMVLHCVYRHSFVSLNVDRDRWNLACDIAVEAIILDLSLNFIDNEHVHEKKTEIMKLQNELRLVSAERIMDYLQKKVTDVEVENLSRIFSVDDHEMWYQPPVFRLNMVGTVAAMLADETKDGQEGGSEGKEGEGGGDEKDGDGQGGAQGESGSSNSISSWLESRKSLSQLWRDVSEQIVKGFEDFQKHIGTLPGSVIDSLKELNRERYDYTAFLKKFAVRGEVMRLDPDEFDYNFYSYGLSLYGNVALIEPLEYREEHRIREFVIAIDTSGSVRGPLVQKFLTKTYNIMKSMDSFFTKINVWIIQCDVVIQDAAKITCQEEFDEYLRNLQLKGFGGTDFRPVFEFVNQKIDEKEFQNLKGLIYFTDGYGIYPEYPGGEVHEPDYPHRRPHYDTAFVFMRSEYDPSLDMRVPPWAIKLILEDQDLESEPVQL
ncbi:MAG: metallopeptidase [Oscillospiraceae bacterium]|nr:metallopeptidase [Oscillospiraceae bacterium]